MCCGSNRARQHALLASDGSSSAPQPEVSSTKFRVTFPNSATVDYDWEWQAAQAVARSGGTYEQIPAEHSESTT